MKHLNMQVNNQEGCEYFSSWKKGNLVKDIIIEYQI